MLITGQVFIGFGFLTLEDDENAANDGEKDSKDIFFHKSSIITTSNYPFSDDYFLRDNDKVNVVPCSYKPTHFCHLGRL